MRVAAGATADEANCAPAGEKQGREAGAPARARGKRGLGEEEHAAAGPLERSVRNLPRAGMRLRAASSGSRQGGEQDLLLDITRVRLDGPAIHGLLLLFFCILGPRQAPAGESQNPSSTRPVLGPQTCKPTGRPVSGPRTRKPAGQNLDVPPPPPGLKPTGFGFIPDLLPSL